MVYDATGCRDTISNIEITNSCPSIPCTFKAVVVALPKTCQNPNGSISVTVTGATTTMTYKWSDLTGTNQPQNRPNVAPGTYRVTISDGGACDTIVQSIIVRDQATNCGGTPCTVIATATPIAKTCTEGGKINASATGGRAPYYYDWADLAGTVNDQNRTNLAAGTYSFIVRDSLGCRDTVENIVIINNCVTTTCTLVALVSAAPKTCQNLGSIVLTINGGTAPYTYRWSDLTGQNQPRDRSNLPAATYYVTVSDARGCDTIIQNIVVRDEAVNCGGTTCTLVAAATSVQVVPPQLIASSLTTIF